MEINEIISAGIKIVLTGGMGLIVYFLKRTMDQYEKRLSCCEEKMTIYKMNLSPSEIMKS